MRVLEQEISRQEGLGKKAVKVRHRYDVLKDLLKWICKTERTRDPIPDEEDEEFAV